MQDQHYLSLRDLFFRHDGNIIYTTNRERIAESIHLPLGMYEWPRALLGADQLLLRWEVSLFSIVERKEN